MVRTALCLDQDDILFPICQDGDSPPACCNFNDYQNNANFSWYEPCNDQACPGNMHSI